MTHVGVATMDNWGGDAAQAASWAGIGTAGVVLVRFLISWIGGRQNLRIDKLEQQVLSLSNRLNAVAYYGMAMHARLKIVAPDSPELDAWDKVLRGAFPLDPNTPAELRELAKKLDGKP